MIRKVKTACLFGSIWILQAPNLLAQTVNPPPPPGGGGSGGGNPDGPLDPLIPFDSQWNLAFLLMAVAFAWYVRAKWNPARKKA